MCWMQGIIGSPIILTWTLPGLNTAGHTKRSTVLGIYFVYVFAVKTPRFAPTFRLIKHSSLYCAGNIAGPHLFLASEEPRYPTAIRGLAGSYGAVIGLQVIYITLCFLENRDRERKGLLAEADFEQEALEGFADLTDKQNKHFRYRI